MKNEQITKIGLQAFWGIFGLMTCIDVGSNAAFTTASAAKAFQGVKQYKYDCGSSKSNPAKGYVRLAIEDTYTKEKGYGIVPSKGGEEPGWRKRGKATDHISTYIFDSGGLTFVQNLPNGKYLVSLASGDAIYDGSASIKLNGVEITPLRKTGPGGFVILRSHRVKVSNGRLKVEIGGEGRLNWLEIAPAAGVKGSDNPKQTVTVHNPAIEAIGDWKVPKNTSSGIPWTVGVGRPNWGKYSSNLHLVPKGEFEVCEDKFGKIVRVNLLKIKEWSKVPGVKKRWPMPVWDALEDLGIPPSSGRLTWNAVRSEIKDVDGDGKPDIFISYGEEPTYGLVMRLDYDDGHVVWKSKKLNPVYEDESRMPVEDIDGDGKYECIVGHERVIYCIDAETGAVKWESPAPGKDVSFIVGHFQDKKKFGIVYRVGHHVACLDWNGRERWTYKMGGHTYGHTMGPYDINGDGYDEIFICVKNRVTALTHDGKVLWDDKSQKEHSDLLVFGDIDSEGRVEVLYDHDGCHAEKGPIYIVDGMTGNIEQKVDYQSIGHKHAQGITLGDFRPDLPGLEFVCTSKNGGMTMWDANGNVLWRNDAPASLVTKGDWDGDGVMDIMVFAQGVNADGIFSVWNGHGKRLYAISFLPSPTVPIYEWGDRSHALMCGPEEGRPMRVDLDGNGKADVLMAFGSWHFGSDQYLFLMESP